MRVPLRYKSQDESGAIWFLASPATIMSYRFLHGPDDPAFLRLLDLYHSAFKRASREPDDRLREEVRGEFRLPFRFLVVEIEARMVGFARFCRLPESGYGFLIHIAVDDAHRGAGLGTDLLAKVVAESAPAPLLVEIERQGRVHDWYVRQGFRPVTMSYTQPALYPDTAPVPYALFASQPIENPAACVEAFYREAWELPSAHPFVRKACET